EGLGNGLAEHVRAPTAVPPVMPVAVVSAVREEDDRRASAEPVELVEERLREVRRRRAAAAVQEDEERTASPSVARDDEHLVEIAADEATVEGKPLDAEAARRSVAAANVANRHEADQRQQGGKRDQDDPPHAPSLGSDWFGGGIGRARVARWERPRTGFARSAGRRSATGSPSASAAATRVATSRSSRPRCPSSALSAAPRSGRAARPAAPRSR